MNSKMGLQIAFSVEGLSTDLAEEGRFASENLGRNGRGEHATYKLTGGNRIWGIKLKACAKKENKGMDFNCIILDTCK